jgi:hypothetical protein
MATERFPKAMYIRQLRKMEEDLRSWEASYRETADNTRDPVVQARLDARANVLEDLRYMALKLGDAFYGLPRLS